MEMELDPYKPPDGRVADVVAPGAIPPLASRSQRFFGAALDGFLFFGALFIMGGGSISGASTPSAHLEAALVGLLAILALFAINLYFLYENGQTIGKKVMGTRIVLRSGERAGLLRIIMLRAFVPGVLGAIPFLGWLFTFADALFIFRADHRCIHDHFAGTVVVVA